MPRHDVRPASTAVRPRPFSAAVRLGSVGPVTASLLAVAALGLTAGALACSVLGVVRGRVPRRTIPAAFVMAAAAVDMLTQGRALAPILWGAVLLALALAMLLGRAEPDARAELAWHAGSTVVMAGMQFAMAGAAVAEAGPGLAPAPRVVATALGSAAPHAHGGPVLLGLLVAAAVALAVAAFWHVPGARRRETGLASLRHPLMAVAMLAMLVATPSA